MANGITIHRGTGGSGSGTPGGSDTQVQFNDSSTFGGDAGLVYDKTTNTLTVGGPIILDVASGDVLLDSDNAANNFEINTGWAFLIMNKTTGKIETESLILQKVLDNSFSVADYQQSRATLYITETDLAAANAIFNTYVETIFGGGGVASVGTLNNLTSYAVIEGAGDADNEYGGLLLSLRADIGTGYTQTTGPVGRLWLGDMAVHGPIAVQPDALNGNVLVINNHYNGSPADSPAAGTWIVTSKAAGAGIDATHAAANTYPVNVGLGITGTSNNGSPGVGFTKGIQIGGSGSPWGESASIVGTGIHVRDYTTYGLLMDNPSGSPTADISVPSSILINSKPVAVVTWEPPVDMRLSLTTNVYVTTTDVTAAGTLYWTTVVSGGTGVVTGYNGSVLARKTIQQKSLSVSMTSGKIKNVYYDYDGDALALGADWTDNVTPSETIADEQGAPVLSSDHTKLWIGVVRASGSNVIEDSVLKRFVWNKYNRKARTMLAVEATDFWSYTSTTIRQANAATANKVEFVQGANDEAVTAQIVAWVSVEDNTAAEYAIVGLGLDSITVFSGLRTGAYINEGAGDTNNVFMPFASSYRGNPAPGYHYFAWLEAGCTGTCNFVGDFADTQSGLTAILNM